MTDKTEDTRNIYQRLAAAMEQVKYVQKHKPEKMQYSIVSHDAVTAKVRPALLAEGIVYHPHKMDHTQNGNRTEVFLMVRFVNIDNPEDAFEIPSLGYGVDAQDKGPGKAVSYAVKYALLKALGLETGDDADLEESEHKPADPAVTISAARLTQLQEKAFSAGVDEAKIAAAAKVPSLEQLPADQFASVMKKLQITIDAAQAKPDLGKELDDEIKY